MSVNYEEEIKTVKSEEEAALNDLENTYGGMIDKSDSYFQSQIDAVNDYKETQTKNQQAQTDFAIKQIHQNKNNAQQDYLKEQSSAYTDWQKQSNPYGANAEQMAENGMQNSGYSESSLVSMYNAYQNRVATARESYNRAVQNYDNAISEARLQNNSILAEIAYNALQQQLQLSLQGFQYKNTLVLDKAKTKLQIDSEYYQRWLDLVGKQQQQSQFDASMALDREKFEWQKAQATKSSSGSSGGYDIKKTSSGSSKSSSGTKINPNFKEVMDQQDKAKSLPINMQSVLDLGGPLNAETVDSMIRAGTLEEYKKDGEINFRRVIKI